MAIFDSLNLDPLLPGWLQLSPLQQQLGPLALPLVACSLLAAALLLERLTVVIGQLAWRSRHNLPFHNQPGHQQYRQPRLAIQGLRLLAQHQHHDKPLREEIAALWLQQQRRQLSSGLRLLQMIATAAPLLGLLGTVLGLMQAFAAIADSQSAINPALLADGLGVAMGTTAFGLGIAIPTLAGCQLLHSLIDHLIQQVENAMNHANLALEGVQP